MTSKNVNLTLEKGFELGFFKLNYIKKKYLTFTISWPLFSGSPESSRKRNSSLQEMRQKHSYLSTLCLPGQCLEYKQMFCIFLNQCGLTILQLQG